MLEKFEIDLGRELRFDRLGLFVREDLSLSLGHSFTPHIAVQPPSRLTIDPVMPLAASEAR